VGMKRLDRMRRLVALALFLGCGSAQPKSTDPTFEEAEPTTEKPPPKDYRHSPVLNAIMKNEVNKPFSKLTFFVFHSDGEFDFTEIAKTAEEFQQGVSKARGFPDPPVESEQGREVFGTFLEQLDRDAKKLTAAVGLKDARTMRASIARLSKTCNNCHHFFRLDIADSPEQ
jgi:cytochrome c556